MNYTAIIKDAWQMTLESPKIKWLIFVPSFMAVLIFVLEMGWQISLYLAKLDVIGDFISLESIRRLIGFLAENGLIGISIVAVVVILLFMFVIPPWITGTIILCIRQKCWHPEKQIHNRQKLVQGLGHFFPLFEFNAATSIFSLIPILLFTATFFRFFDTWFEFAWPVIAVYSIIALFINLFISFTPYYIVTEKMKVVEAIKRSFALVFLNFGATLMIFLLMLLVNLRILLNVAVVVGVPLAIVAAFVLTKSSTIFMLTMLIGTALMCFTAYVSAIVTIFSTGVWYLSFEILKQRQKEIEEENQQDANF